MGFDGVAGPLSFALFGGDRAIAERDLDQDDLSEQTRWMLAVRDNGDREAFARLFDHFAPRVKAMAMRGGARAALAEEIAQDVMLRVWSSAAQFDPTRAQVSGWIYQIAPQPADRPRAPRAAPGAGRRRGAVDRTWTSAARSRWSRRWRELRLALAALPPKQREMVEKAYMGELTHQEISRADQPAARHGQVAAAAGARAAAA